MVLSDVDAFLFYVSVSSPPYGLSLTYPSGYPSFDSLILSCYLEGDVDEMLTSNFSQHLIMLLNLRPTPLDTPIQFLDPPYQLRARSSLTQTLAYGYRALF